MRAWKLETIFDSRSSLMSSSVPSTPARKNTCQRKHQLIQLPLNNCVNFNCEKIIRLVVNLHVLMTIYDDRSEGKDYLSEA